MEIIYEENHKPTSERYRNAIVTDGKNTYYYSCGGEYIRLGMDLGGMPTTIRKVRDDIMVVTNGEELFNISTTPSQSHHFMVFVNGVLLREPEYTLFNKELRITKNSGPLATGDKISVLYYEEV